MPRPRSLLLVISLASVGSLAACRQVAPEIPVSGDEELCCKSASSDNVSFSGCRVTEVCRSSESVWVRGPVECAPADSASCEGGRCCTLQLPPEPEPEPGPEAPPAPGEELLTDPLQIRELPRPLAVPKLLCPGTLERGITGTVVLQVNIDPRGAVTEVGVHSGIDPECDEVAREALRGAVFKPARDLEGEPVAFALRYEYRFVVADEDEDAPGMTSSVPEEPS